MKQESSFRSPRPRRYSRETSSQAGIRVIVGDHKGEMIEIIQESQIEAETETVGPLIRKGLRNDTMISFIYETHPIIIRMASG